MKQRRSSHQVLMRSVEVCAAAGVIALSGCRSEPPAAPVAPVVEPARSVTPVPQQKSASEVRKLLEDAAAAAPNDPQTQLELALLDRNTRDFAGAERRLAELTQHFPHFARGWYHLGLLYLTRGDSARALRPLIQAAETAPGDAMAQLNAGLVCYRADRRADALRYAQAALRLEPQMPEPYMLLARLYDQHGTAKIAIANLHNYLERSPNPSPGYYLIGRIYARQADRDNAALWLNKAVEADPNNAEYWTTLGRVYYELFNADRAQEGIRCFEKALALDPNKWEAHQFLGRALAGQRKYDEAIPHLRTALQSSTEPGPLYYDLGQALLRSGKTEEGQKALTAFQDYTEFTRGVTKLNNAINAAPKDREKRYALARFCIAHRQYRAALNALQDAERLLGSDTTSQSLHAQIMAANPALHPSPPSLPPSGSPSDLGLGATEAMPPLTLPNLQGGSGDAR